MEKALIKGYIAKRVAKEFKDGDFVNLGIGLPTMVPAYLPEDVHVILQAEVGMAGQGGKPEVADPNVVDAGGQPSSIAPGGAFIDSATSFGLIRGGHVNATVLGALQVDEKGNLANWIIPGKMVPGMGGAMDLVAGAQNIIVVMTHASKNGESKLLPQCTLPLTGVGCIRRVLTDLALLDIVDGAFVLREVAPGVSPDEVMRKTAGRLIVADDVREMRFS